MTDTARIQSRKLQGRETQGTQIGEGYLSTAQLAAAERVIADELGGPARVEFAYLGGSLAVGLGNAFSDVDLYVVGAQLPAADSAVRAGGVLVHVNPVPAVEVLELIGITRGFRATSTERTQIQLDFKTLYKLTHLATGRVLAASPRWAAERARLDLRVLRQLMICRNANIAGGAAEDAAGALISADPLTALTASQTALQAGAEAVLAAVGDLYCAPKFLLRRLMRSGETGPWFPLIWRLLHDVDPARTDVSADEARPLVEERLAVAGYLLAWSVLEGWDGDGATGLPDPARAGATTSARPGEEPTRMPYYMPIRFADGLGLVGPDQGYQVDEEALRLWRSLPAAVGGRGAGTAAISELIRAGAVAEATAQSAAGLAAARTPVIEPCGGFASHPRTDPARVAA